jgi:hypothetical protein
MKVVCANLGENLIYDTYIEDQMNDQDSIRDMKLKSLGL